MSFPRKKGQIVEIQFANISKSHYYPVIETEEGIKAQGMSRCLSDERMIGRPTAVVGDTVSFTTDGATLVDGVLCAWSIT